MDKISKIINSELKAQEIIKKARQQAENIKKKTEEEGKQIIENARKEAEEDLKKFKENLNRQFEKLSNDFKQKNSMIKHNIEKYLDKDLHELLNQAFNDFLNSIERD